MNEFYRKIQLTRRDIGNLLFHFTKRNGTLEAFSVLKKIIQTRTLLGGTGLVRGNHQCVGFTEAPISEVVSYFNTAKILLGSQKLRYEPFGIAFSKKYLFKQGARPVIYQPDKDYLKLPEELRYRHVTFDLDRGIDFTWEREWRIETDALNLEPEDCLIIVPHQEHMDNLYNEFLHWEPEYVSNGEDYDIVGSTPHRIWKIVTLEMFGFEKS